MKSLVLFACLAGFATVTKAQSLSDFNWIKGDWSGTSQGAGISESWKQLDDGSFAGSGFVVAGKDTVVTEAMLIRKIDNRIVFIARINDSDPVLFTFREKNAGGEYVFENKEHDFPQRIVYKPGDESLDARIEGTVEGKEIKELYRYSRR